MSNVYIVSDLHIGHKNICKYRPEFEDVNRHNTAMIENVLRTCGKRDTLWLLGDICFDESYDWIYYEFCQNIGQVNLVIGNHCSENNERQRILGYAHECGVKLHSLVSYKGCWLSHHPIHPQELRGKFNIHGHMHREQIDDPRYYNACVEHTGWKPKLFKEILAELQERN